MAFEIETVVFVFLARNLSRLFAFSRSLTLSRFHTLSFFSLFRLYLSTHNNEGARFNKPSC